MSDTIVDMPKVAQMLDAGWYVQLCKNDLGTYTAAASHPNQEFMRRMVSKLRMTPEDDDGIDTDDFTPEQALTRLAYKVHGEII